MTTETPKLLTVGQAVEKLAVSRRTLYRWIDSGTLPTVRFSSRCIRIPEDGISNFIRERTVNSVKR